VKASVIKKVDFFPVSHAYKSRYLVLPTLKDRMHRMVVGWSEKGPCNISVFWTELLSGRIDLIICGGDKGLRVLANAEEEVVWNPKEKDLPPGWSFSYLSLEPRDLPPDVLSVVNTFYYDVGIQVDKTRRKTKVKRLSKIITRDEVWLVLSSNQKPEKVIGWSHVGPVPLKIYWGKFLEDGNIALVVSGGSQGVRIISPEEAEELDGQYDEGGPPGIGAPFLRVPLAALPEDLRQILDIPPELRAISRPQEDYILDLTSDELIPLEENVEVETVDS